MTNAHDDRLFTVGGVTLERHQVDLLLVLVEAHRRAPGQEFMIQEGVNAMNSVLVYHPGLEEGLAVPFGPIKTLRDVGLIRLENAGQYLWTFSLLPRASVFYQKVQRSLGQPVERVEQNIRRLLQAEGFKQRYPSACEKWAQAEDLLWGADAQEQLTAIGHHCREAAQHFATALVVQHQPPNVNPDPSKTKARLRAVIDHRRPALGEKAAGLLAALVDYWDAVVEFGIRQDHGAQKEGTPLTWEDARRVVFQTLNVMVEVHIALSHREPRSA